MVQLAKNTRFENKRKSSFYDRGFYRQSNHFPSGRKNRRKALSEAKKLRKKGLNARVIIFEHQNRTRTFGVFKKPKK